MAQPATAIANAAKRQQREPQRGHNWELAAMPGILLLAVSLRLALMQFHWPTANADESIIDLMARHIAFRGEHPIFFWGQHYMGAIQAYLGALLIRLVGSSAFSVRLGTLLMFMLYLVCMYLLVRLLYTPAFALFIITVLSIGSDRMIGIPLVANGGYAETMLFGAVIFLLSSWLAFTRPTHSSRANRARLLAYVGLGVTIGLALWSNQLILPAILAAGVFLLLCCRRELRGQASGALIVGCLVGAIPLIIYNISAAPGQNSLAVLWSTVFSGAPRAVPFWEQFAHVMLVSLPLATGTPFTVGIHAVCATIEPYAHPSGNLAALFPSSDPWLCVGMRGGWSLGILLLWGIALAGVVLGLGVQRGRRQNGAPELDMQAAWQQRTRMYARSTLLASGAIWLVLFTFSAAAQVTPRASSRYLICLLFAAPAILWPLWQSASGIRERMEQGPHCARIHAAQSALSALSLCTILSVYLVGVGDILANLSASQSDFHRTNTVIQALLDHDATYIYSDYNTCSLLIFQSNERVVCAVLDNQLRLSVNRYAPYLAQVAAAPHPAYLFPIESGPAQALDKQVGKDARYHWMRIAGYVLYYYSS